MHAGVTVAEVATLPRRQGAAGHNPLDGVDRHWAIHSLDTGTVVADPVLADAQPKPARRRDPSTPGVTVHRVDALVRFRAPTARPTVQIVTASDGENAHPV